MSKYDRLWEYIAENDPAALHFEDVQAICGFPIDHAFLNCKRELEAYGYRVGKISLKEKAIRVERIEKQ